MKTRLLRLIACAAIAFGITSTAFAQGTAFTYQGQLNDGAARANGTYDLTFTLQSAVSGATQVGVALTNSAVLVSNGLFTVSLDFGNQFPGANRWLEVGVRTNGGVSFTTLSPRQQLTPSPYALYAPNSGTATSATTVAATGITGTLPIAQLPGNVVTNGASGVFLSGRFAGDGAGVTNLNVMLNSGGAINPSGLRVASSPTVGSKPFSVTSSDVNGDGKPDLVSANFNANTLTVLTNNGSGGFAVSSSPAVGGNSPKAVVSADVNGDGRPDLVSANFNASTLTVLTNNGAGGFSISSILDAGSNPESVASADVNGDGKPDLISANVNVSALKIFTNNGSGGFAVSSSPTVGGVPRAVVSADVDGDGTPDLVSANSGAATLTVLTNNGSGGFAVSSSPSVGSLPHWVTSADVNGDGKPDLISANAGANTLTVLTNNGNGGFAVSSSPGVGASPHSVTAADVNGDGKPDLISANFDANTLTVLTNNGSGGFARSSSPNVGASPNSVTSADVNGDGKADLISADFNSNSLTVLWNATAFAGAFVGDGTGLIGLNASGITSGTLADGCLSANVALRAGGNTFDGNQTLNGNQFFGAQTRQMLNLYNAVYGIGVQFNSLYFRCDNLTPTNGFIWYRGGVHNSGYAQPGAGGTTLMHLVQGGLYVNGAIVPSSDRNLKENFAAVSSREILEKVAGLSISRWNFKGDTATPHVGPMAQDFHAAFGLGTDDRHIATVDADGVALAAIQGLNQKVEEKNAEIADLKARLEKLERLMEAKGGSQ